MIIKHPFGNPFDQTLPALALALLALFGMAFTPAALAGGKITLAEAQDASRQAVARTETYTVSSGGVDVTFDVTFNAEGAVTSESRTWMLLPDEEGYRAYVTERKGVAGEFVETARGELYDPDADGISDADVPNDAPRQAAALDRRLGY